jgi:hypothetical protein
MSRLNDSSFYLSQCENEEVFSSFSSESRSLCTVIAQVFQTKPPIHTNWNKVGVGVICLKKDYYMRSYFLCLYCFKARKIIWQEECYRLFAVTREKPFLVTFEGERCVVAINFAFEKEADKFCKSLAGLAQRKAHLKNKSNRMQSNAVGAKVRKFNKSDIGTRFLSQFFQELKFLL